MKSLFLCLFLITIFIFLELAYAKKDKVRLRDIQVLTLSEGKWTTGRRSSPIKQLRCIGGYCKRVGITSAQCYNRGFDGRDVSWECKANMPSAYKFGRMEVACEGYDYPEDDYVLAGSCGLEYSIEEVNGPSSGQYYDSHYSYNYNANIDSDKSPIGVLIFIVCVIVFIYFACIHRNRRENEGTFPGADDDYRRGASAPPPPGFRNDYYDDSCRGTRNQGSYSSQNSSSSSGPGFFSGMAAGSLLGYLFGSGSNTETRYRGSRSQYSGWGAPSTSSGYSGFSSSSGTSSGFATTSRR